MEKIVQIKQPTKEQREKNSKFRIAISYPPMPSEKGTPCLGQNRQFQWFANPTFIYPMVPAYAASLLKSQGYDVMWDDGIAEELSQDEWLERIKKFKPNLIVFETKTPVVKRHWKVIEVIKDELPETKIVLCGDHVTALPMESMKNSLVDVIATGGDYDFLALNIANSYNHKVQLEPGIWYRKKVKSSDGSRSKEEIKNTGHFLLNHHLDELPMIDRDLTKWKLYAFKNGNYKRTPGTYTFAARDCWWGKCTFCFPAGAKITTDSGYFPIEDIVNNKQSAKVLTHTGRYRKITHWHRRAYLGPVITVEADYLAEKILATSNHPIYICRQENKTKPEIIAVPAEEISPGDYLSLPIDRRVKDMKTLDLTEIIRSAEIKLKTRRKISPSVIEKIKNLRLNGVSQRRVAIELKIDRETVKRYFDLIESDELTIKINPLIETKSDFRFEAGKKSVTREMELSAESLRLFGYYLAEGHVSLRGNRPNSACLGFTFSQKEKEYIKDVKTIFGQIFGLSLNASENKANNTTQLYLGSSILARAFELLFGSNSLNKSLPASFMHLSLSKQKQLLVGLFRGDGHVRKERVHGGRELIFSTVSEKLARQVYDLLLRQNIIASFRLPKAGKKTKNQAYVIHLYGDDIKKFFPTSLSAHKQKHYQKGFIFNNYALLPVKNIIRSAYSGDVYNLTVDDDHSYTANFVAVKNCSWTTLYPGKDYRKHSVKRVLDEIGELIEKYQVREIMDDSGSFPIGEWLGEFCDGMIERGYNKKIKLDCNMRLKSLNQEEYNLMGKAGFRFILYGLESANQKTLDRINKNLKVEEIEKGVKMAKAGGLEPHITTMMGYPWEKVADAERTVALSKRLFDKGFVDTLQATIVIPYPGTPLFKQCQENGWLTTEDWDKYDQRTIIMKSELTEEKIKELTQDLYKSFVTPKFIWRKIVGVRSFDDIKFLFRAGGKVLGHLTDFSSKKSNKSN